MTGPVFKIQLGHLSALIELALWLHREGIDLEVGPALAPLARVRRLHRERIADADLPSDEDGRGRRLVSLAPADLEQFEVRALLRLLEDAQQEWQTPDGAPLVLRWPEVARSWQRWIRRWGEQPNLE